MIDAYVTCEGNIAFVPSVVIGCSSLFQSFIWNDGKLILKINLVNWKIAFYLCNRKTKIKNNRKCNASNHIWYTKQALARWRLKVCAGLSHGCHQTETDDIKIRAPLMKRGFFFAWIKSNKMIRIPQHSTQELGQQCHIAAVNSYVLQYPVMVAVGKGLWISESFNSKTNNSRLRSVVWQDWKTCKITRSPAVRTAGLFLRPL